MFFDAKPNKAHLKLAELEHAGKLSAVITQNMSSDKLVVLNKSATPRDAYADLCIQEPIGEVLESIKVQI